MLKTFAAVAGSLLLLSVPATALAGESPRKCGTVSGGIAMYDIKATGVSCASARKTARAWRMALVAGECADGRFRCKARGFTCRAKRPAEVHYPVTCKQGAQRVRWDIHAD